MLRASPAIQWHIVLHVRGRQSHFERSVRLGKVDFVALYNRVCALLRRHTPERRTPEYPFDMAPETANGLRGPGTGPGKRTGTGNTGTPFFLQGQSRHPFPAS